MAARFLARPVAVPRSEWLLEIIATCLGSHDTLVKYLDSNNGAPHGKPGPCLYRGVEQMCGWEALPGPVRFCNLRNGRLQSL